MGGERPTAPSVPYPTCPSMPIVGASVWRMKRAKAPPVGMDALTAPCGHGNDCNFDCNLGDPWRQCATRQGRGGHKKRLCDAENGMARHRMIGSDCALNLAGGQGVGGSSPLAPTNDKWRNCQYNGAGIQPAPLAICALPEPGEGGLMRCGLVPGAVALGIPAGWRMSSQKGC